MTVLQNGSVSFLHSDLTSFFRALAPNILWSCPVTLPDDVESCAAARYETHNIIDIVVGPRRLTRSRMLSAIVFKP